jgi:hypothetical protein
MELNFLLMCVEEKSIPNTQVARNKAFMAIKLCDLIDAPETQPETTENESQADSEPKAPPKKK